MSHYSVELRDSIMIAHSLKDPFFGPAQSLHGATFTVDVSFVASRLNGKNVVVDIGKAMEALAATLKPLNYQNLDEFDPFDGQLTTTEFLARYIFDELAECARTGGLGEGSGNVEEIHVLLHESHFARAGYRGSVR
ncbi:6-pyruvoyl trahydropterin synthase family protein [Pararhizobium haloflavum]|uniref:6-pyruvoyl trahydropterin synthase family protein n=1 Tax=Pararhizobium haloflavum TaxID=2037914 RepID=UPI001FDEECA0|nr:6-carboxytetrahydropterin synthase [Pararhizobium haloflavum]